MMCSPGVGRHEKPCGTYFGNMCTGFGNLDQTCMFCGWDRWDHSGETTFIRVGSHA